jgi:CRISPR system Cascade subunit CasC
MSATTLQAHYLTSYAASLLNRDDAGFAKRMDFGGHSRIRVSSQCLKRAWRESFMAMGDLDLPTGIRSTLIFEELVLPMVVSTGVDADRARAGIRKLLEGTIKGSMNSDKPLSLITGQPVFMGQREVEVVAAKMAETLKQEGPADALVAALLKTTIPAKNFAHLFGLNDSLAYGVESAMFGRFVTSDVLTRVDSSVSVANPFTVHAATTELDYFTAVDDLAPRGAAHMGDSELSAGLFYLYLSIDMAALTANLTGCNPRDWKSQDLTVVKKLSALLLRMAATKSPGAKKGSTAPYARSEFVLLETGVGPERQLVNAFRKPVRAAGTEDIMVTAQAAVARHLAKLDGMYGPETTRFVSSLEDVDLPRTLAVTALDDAIAQALDATVNQPAAKPL